MSDLMYENSLGELCVKAQRETAENERERERRKGGTKVPSVS